MPSPKLIAKTEAEKQEAFVRALGREPSPKPKKPRKRPDVKGHLGIERGSDAAADLFWAEVAKVMEAKGGALPSYKPFGFKRDPSPVSTTARAIFRAWNTYERELARAGFARATPEQREDFYWGAVDMVSMGGGPKPDPYVFGFDEIPTRPARLPEPEYVKRIREARAHVEVGFVRGSSTTVEAALATLGLNPGATAAEITKAFRKRVLATHPDRGGSAAAFHATVAAKNTALAHLETPR